MKIKILDKQSILVSYPHEGIDIKDIRQHNNLTTIEVHYQRTPMYFSPRYLTEANIIIDPCGSVGIYLPDGQLWYRVTPPAYVLRTPLALLIWCRDWIWQKQR